MANTNGKKPRIGQGKNPTELQTHQGGMVKASIFMPGPLNSKLKKLADLEQRKTGSRTSISTLAVELIQEALEFRKEARS